LGGFNLWTAFLRLNRTSISFAVSFWNLTSLKSLTRIDYARKIALTDWFFFKLSLSSINLAVSGYGGVDKFKVFDLILEFADQSFLRAYCLIQLHLLLLNEVSVSLDVLQFLLEDGEQLLLILVLFLFDLTSLFVFLKLPDLLILLSQFIVELEDCLPVL